MEIGDEFDVNSEESAGQSARLEARDALLHLCSMMPPQNRCTQSHSSASPPRRTSREGAEPPIACHRAKRSVSISASRHKEKSSVLSSSERALLEEPDSGATGRLAGLA